MKWFTKHPNSIGESYFEHFCFATQFGLQMIIGGLACFLHAFFPFIFQKTGSNILLKLTHNMIERTPQTEKRFVDLSKTIERKNNINESVYESN